MKYTYLIILVSLSLNSWLWSQENCYDGRTNLLGVSNNTSLVDSLSCTLSSLSSDEVGATPYKVYSVADYSIAEFKKEADVERYRISRYDSLTNISPYRIILWWEYVETNPFGHCRISFTYPDHQTNNNCFSDAKIGLIEGKLQILSDSLTSDEGLAIGTYIALETAILDLAISEVERVQNCCNAAEPENQCNACLVGDELAQLKQHYYVYRMTGDPVLNYDVNSAKPPTENSNELKSSSNYTAYVNDVLPFEGTTIDLFSEYQEFLALGDTICDFPVIITNDEVLCEIDLDGWDNGDRTIINIASDTDGNFYFELSEYSYESCYLFFDFMNDRYPEVFGFRYLDEVIPEEDLFEAGGRGEAEPCEEFRDAVPTSFFVSPSSALISRISPDGKRLHPAFLSASLRSDQLIGLGTLHRFFYENEEYRYMRRPVASNGNDYFRVVEIEAARASKQKNNSKLANLVGFTTDKPWLIAAVGEEHLVTGLIDIGCGGLKQCYWEKIATTVNLSDSPMPNQVPTSSGGVCCVNSGLNSTVCCSLGRNYIESGLLAATSKSDSAAIYRVGAIMCEMGEALFGEYANNSWGEYPDALKYLYQHSYDTYINSISSYENFEQYITAFRDSTIAPLRQISEVSGWEKMKVVLSKLSDGQIGALSAKDRMHIIRVMSEKLNADSNIDFCAVYPPLCPTLVQSHMYKALKATSNEWTVVRVLSTVKSEEKCEFVDSIFSDKQLVDKLFFAFNDAEYRILGDGNYPDMINQLLLLFKSCDTYFEINSRPSNPDRFVVFGREHLEGNGPSEDYNLTCSIRIEALEEGFRKFKISNPFPKTDYDIAGPGGIYLPGSTYCGYSYNETTSERYDNEFEFEGPLDYVYVYFLQPNYAGIQNEAGVLYKMPAFLFRFFSDFQDEQDWTAVIDVSLFAIGLVATSAEVVLATGLIRVLALVELGLTLGSPIAHSVIRSDDFAELLGGKSSNSYQEFVFWFQIFEIAMSAGVAKTSIYAPIQESGLMANRIARHSMNYNPDHPGFIRLRQMTNAYGDMFWKDYSNVKRLVADLGGIENMGGDLFLLSEQALRRLDTDINLLSSSWYAELLRPEGVAAYYLLNQVGDWRKSTTLLRRLSDDIVARPNFKSRLIQDGENGVMGWRLIDETHINVIWCN